MKVVEKFAEFFQEDSGGSSSMRLLMLVSGLLVVSIWGFIAVWLVTHQVEGQAYEVPDIPWNVVTLVLGIVGLKAYQKGKEGSTAVSSEKTTTTTESVAVTPQEQPK
jgi:hypothetical protein